MFQLFPPFALVVTGTRSGNTTSDSDSVVFPDFSGSSCGPLCLVVVVPIPTKADKATYSSRRLMAFMATHPTPTPAFCLCRLPAKIQVRRFHRVYQFARGRAVVAPCTRTLFAANAQRSPRHRHRRRSGCEWLIFFPFNCLMVLAPVARRILPPPFALNE